MWFYAVLDRRYFVDNQNYRRQRKKTSIVVPIMIIFIAITFSALAAAVWQLSSPTVQTLAPLDLDPSIVNQFEPENIAVAVKNPPAKSEPEPESEPEEKEEKPAKSEKKKDEASSAVESKESEPTSSLPEQETPAVVSAGALGKSERVSSSYFDDAAFIGDSLTVGMKLYDVMGNAEVLASVGIGLDTIFTKQAIKQPDGSMLTVFDALEKAESKKVYIMLGANSLMSSHDYLIDRYGKLVDEVKARTSDDAIIYVQSILPINEPKFKKNYPKNTTPNADIDSFNQRLCQMAADRGVYYLDVASVFKDESGALSTDVTSDGMHINSDQYVTWIDYLKVHAAP